MKLFTWMQDVDWENMPQWYKSIISIHSTSYRSIHERTKCHTHLSVWSTVTPAQWFYSPVEKPTYLISGFSWNIKNPQHIIIQLSNGSFKTNNMLERKLLCHMWLQLTPESIPLYITLVSVDHMRHCGQHTLQYCNSAATERLYILSFAYCHRQ